MCGVIRVLVRSTEEGNLLECIPRVKPCGWSPTPSWTAPVRGDIVLDGFLGSGTTVIAAERGPALLRVRSTRITSTQSCGVGRRTRASEPDLASSGRSFNELEAEVGERDAR